MEIREGNRDNIGLSREQRLHRMERRTEIRDGMGQAVAYREVCNRCNPLFVPVTFVIQFPWYP
jgi:hypothetical protein